MSFLAPAVLAGLAAIVIPIVVHLVQKERKRLVEFPSLMFIRRIPYRSVRRRAIRNYLLLALRIAVIVLLVSAFARPFFREAGAALPDGGEGRDVVVLLDRSASMGYADNWQRAQEAARDAVRSLGPGDRGTVAFFDTGVEMGPRRTAEHGSIVSAIDRASPGAGATRYGPALRAAAGVLETSTLPRREIVIVSDFQRAGWDAADEVAMPAGVTVRTVPVSAPSPSDAAVTGLTLEREAAGDREQVRVAARIVNRGNDAVANRDAWIEADGRRLESRSVSLEPGSATVVTFTPVAVPPTGMRVSVRLGPDAFPADDVFHAFVPPVERIPVLIVESPNPQPDSSLYVARALEVGRVPAFEVTTTRADRVTSDEIRRARVIVLNDAPVSVQLARAVEASVRGGAGLLVALGERSTWPPEVSALLPGVAGQPVDRSGTRGGTLGYTDLGHPAFEIFSTPRSGDLTAARVFRYRQLVVPASQKAEAPAAASIIARFDDGGVALVEGQAGQGRVMVWTSTFDSYWNDLALKPVFVPFLHQAMKHLSGYVEPKLWYLAGEMFETARSRVPGVEPSSAASETFVVVRPGGEQQAEGAGEGPLSFQLTEQGFYEVRAAGEATSSAPAGAVRSMVVAVNLDPVESNLEGIDPAELSGAVASSSSVAPHGAASTELTLEERERRQSLWWYLLVSVLLLLAVELAFANRHPRTA